VVLFPTWFNGQHTKNEWLIGPDRALNPNRYFIVVVNIFGNGLSSSPSNTPPPFDRIRFPHFTIADNVNLQRRLLREKLEIGRLSLVIGRSMGAQQAFQWGALYPDEVERILPICGSARTSPHNYLFLAAVKGAIVTDPAWHNGEYDRPPLSALNMVRLIYDGWVLSQTFYRQGLHLRMGYETTEAYANRGPDGFLSDANDLLAQIWTWQQADISDNPRYGGDFDAALAAISAKAIVMPCRTDLYFPPEDSEIEVARMQNAELRTIPSIWGHRAGAPGTDPVDIKFVDDAVKDLLSS
jgi:homoserine O-acetyltransferase